jgi:hypothetical protein
MKHGALLRSKPVQAEEERDRAYAIGHIERNASEVQS